MQTRNFFDQVNFALHVQSPSWNADTKLRLRAGFGNEFKSEALEDGDNLMRFEIAAENAVNARNAQDHRRLIKLAGNGVDRVAVEVAAAGVDNSSCDQRAGERRRAVIRAALETMRGVGVQAVAFGRLAHGDGIKPG